MFVSKFSIIVVQQGGGYFVLVLPLCSIGLLFNVPVFCSRRVVMAALTSVTPVGKLTSLYSLIMKVIFCC